MEWLIPFLATSLSVGIGCQQDRSSEVTGPTGPPVQQTVGFEIEVSSLTAMPGDSVTVALAVRSAQEGDLAGVLGTMRLGRGKLALLGQVPDSGAIAVLAFRVLETGYLDEVSFSPEQVVDTARQIVEVKPKTPVVAVPDLPRAAGAQHLTDDDWARLLDVQPDTTAEPVAGPRLLGDATDDREVSALDAARVAAISVGNQPLPPAASDDMLASDVTGDGAIDLLDVVGVVRYVAGLDVAQPIGALLRFTLPVPERVVDTARAIISNQITLEFRESVSTQRAEFLVEVSRQHWARRLSRRGSSPS